MCSIVISRHKHTEAQKSHEVLQKNPESNSLNKNQGRERISAANNLAILEVITQKTIELRPEYISLSYETVE